MKFGKRTRNWAVNGIRILTERNDEQEGILSDPQPRVAPPLTDEEEQTPMSAPPQEEEPLISDDPEKKLLTALGRFQRQVNRAEDGRAGDNWTDECMNQLITGIEMAVENKWPDVREALTDTARILQSFEDGNNADESVPFLQDSYEILCLMVGDLMVDNVRSGVMQKWRQRYQQAVRDLEDGGCALIEDDDTLEAPARAGTAPAFEQEPADEERGPSGAIEFDSDARFPNNVTPFRSTFDAGIERREDRYLQTTPADDDAEAPFETPGDFFSAPVRSDSPVLPADVDDARPDPVENEAAPFDAPDAPEEQAVHGASMMDWGDGEEEAVAPELPAGADLSAEVQDDAVEAEDDSAYDAWLESLKAAETRAAPERAPEEEAAGAEAAQTDLFGEMAAEEETPEPEPVVELIEEPDVEAAPEERVAEVAPVAEAPAPVAAPVFDPDSPEGLLHFAQQAMTEGKMGDARTMALRLAARMAQLEANRAETVVDEATHALEENAAAIREGESGVKEAESSLGTTREERVAREKARKDQLAANQKLQGDAGGIETTITDLDEQIRVLQEKRAEEVKSLEGVRASLDDGSAELDAIEAEIASLEAAIEKGELSLEQARELVAALEEERTRREEILASAEEVLARQWSGVEDISRTFRAVTGESLEEEKPAPTPAEEPAAEAEAEPTAEAETEPKAEQTEIAVDGAADEEEGA